MRPNNQSAARHPAQRDMCLTSRLYLDRQCHCAVLLVSSLHARPEVTVSGARKERAWGRNVSEKWDYHCYMQDSKLMCERHGMSHTSVILLKIINPLIHPTPIEDEVDHCLQSSKTTSPEFPPLDLQATTPCCSHHSAHREESQLPGSAQPRPVTSNDFQDPSQ